MSLFQSLLAHSWDALPAEVQDSHIKDAPVTLEGVCQIENGPSWLARLLVWLFRFPPTGDDVPVRVNKAQQGQQEVWTRHFGQHKMRSTLGHGPRGLQEGFGAITFDIGLKVKDGSLHYPVQAARLGPVPLPKIALPVSITREYAEDGKFWFDVSVYTPLTKAPMVRYKGWLIHPSKS